MSRRDEYCRGTTTHGQNFFHSQLPMVPGTFNFIFHTKMWLTHCLTANYKLMKITAKQDTVHHTEHKQLTDFSHVSASHQFFLIFFRSGSDTASWGSAFTRRFNRPISSDRIPGNTEKQAMVKFFREKIVFSGRRKHSGHDTLTPQQPILVLYSSGIRSWHIESSVHSATTRQRISQLPLET